MQETGLKKRVGRVRTGGDAAMRRKKLHKVNEILRKKEEKFVQRIKQGV